jgi:hypothetical protein
VILTTCYAAGLWISEAVRLTLVPVKNPSAPVSRWLQGGLNRPGSEAASSLPEM